MTARLDHVQVAIPAGEEDLARAFYGKLLGLSEIPKPPELERSGGCWFALGASQLHVGADPDFRPAKKAHVAIAVDDLAAFRAVVEAAGHPVLPDIPLGNRERFFTEDKHGNRVEIVAA